MTEGDGWLVVTWRRGSGGKWGASWRFRLTDHLSAELVKQPLMSFLIPWLCSIFCTVYPSGKNSICYCFTAQWLVFTASNCNQNLYCCYAMQGKNATYSKCNLQKFEHLLSQQMIIQICRYATTSIPLTFIKRSNNLLSFKEHQCPWCSSGTRKRLLLYENTSTKIHWLQIFLYIYTELDTLIDNNLINMHVFFLLFLRKINALFPALLA